VLFFLSSSYRYSFILVYYANPCHLGIIKVKIHKFIFLNVEDNEQFEQLVSESFGRIQWYNNGWQFEVTLGFGSYVYVGCALIGMLMRGNGSGCKFSV